MLSTVHYHVYFDCLNAYAGLLDVFSDVPVDETRLAGTVVAYNHNVESFYGAIISLSSERRPSESASKSLAIFSRPSSRNPSLVTFAGSKMLVYLSGRYFLMMLSMNLS